MNSPLALIDQTILFSTGQTRDAVSFLKTAVADVTFPPSQPPMSQNRLLLALI